MREGGSLKGALVDTMMLLRQDVALREACARRKLKEKGLVRILKESEGAVRAAVRD